MARLGVINVRCAATCIRKDLSPNSWNERFSRRFEERTEMKTAAMLGMTLVHTAIRVCV